MMTSLSTMIGMLPLALELALGAERFSPLAKAVIGGLLASTLLTMVVIPVLYDAIDGIAAPRVRALSGVATALLVAAVLAPASAHAGDEGIEEAWGWVQDHPALQASAERVRASEARTREATGRLFPELELTARMTRRDPFEPASIQIPIVLPDGSSPDPVELGEAWDTQHFVGATVTQPLFAGGRALHSRKAAAAAEGGARAQREATAGELWLALSEAWYGYAVATDVVGIRHDVVVAAQQREASLQRLLDEGRAVELQLSAVALKRAEAEQAESRARADAAVAYRGLTALLGREVDAVGVDVVSAAGARLDRPLPEGQSARVDEAEGRAHAARAQGKAATGALLPTLAVRASAQYANPDLTQFPVRNEWGTYWDASLVMRWTLDAGVRWGAARAARLDAHAAELATEALARQEDVARARALATVEMAGQQLQIAAERVRLAEHAASVAETALENGRMTPADVLDRRADIAMARAAELRVALETLLAVETARVQSGVSGPAAP
jgi:outer membrane protein TolC